MRNRPTEFPNISLYFLVLILLLGCSKDSDLLNDALFNGETQSVEDRTKTEAPTEEAETESQEEIPNSEPETENIEEPVEESVSNLESRLSTFSTLHDAHLQSGKGYNQQIIRLEEGHRTSYLMFDLSPIDSIGATITGAKLQITINSDDGDGTVSVHKGISSNWTENSLGTTSTPDIEVQLGSLTKQYKIGATEEIDLEITSLQASKSTLILEHKEGNDLAFASKEHPSNIGPKLVVTYDAPLGAAPIEIPELVIEEVTTTEEEVTTETENTTEEPQNEATTGENEGPMAVADATPSAGGAPLNVQFKGSNSTDDASIKSFSWNFKDGSSATTANPSHSFDDPGSYEVVLTVTDEQGLTDTDTVTITVNEEENEGPKAVATATPSTGTAPLEVQFTGSNSTDDNSISSYAWNFKDGATAANANPSHTFDEPGTYQVQLTVKDENGLSDSKTITITVNEATNEAPKAVATATPSSGVAPLEVQFKGSNSTDDKEIKTYFWNFKDGTNAGSANPSHTFAEAGTYEVRFTVKDEEGQTDSETIVITVSAPQQNEAPVAVATANKTSGQAPLNVQFVGNNSTDDNAVTSYAWNFKDGTTATSANPSHTFTDPGSYAVTLTVKDAAGLSSTKTVNITVNPQNNPPPPNSNVDYYVTTTGKASNNGKTQSTAWSLEHAFYAAQAGDVIYVKAGNYGNKQLLTRNAGTSGNPIKFIGYKNTPGDINSSNGPTFSYGQSVNASNMPLLQSNGQGVAFTVHDRYIHLENFQITRYNVGTQVISIATNVTLKNIIATKLGNQSSSSSYTGFGFDVQGNNALIENCFVHNAGAEAFKLFDSDYSKIRYSRAYADNHSNPMDYYFLITGGTNNTIVENCIADRVQEISHPGHGFILKDLATNNTIRNCTVKKTKLEMNFSGVSNNTFDGCTVIGGGRSSSFWEATIAIKNGAHHNLIKNTSVRNTWQAINLVDDDDGYVGPGGDRDAVSLGNDNTFDNLDVQNVEYMMKVGGGNNFAAKATNYTFKNCSLKDFEAVAITYYRSQNFKFQNSSFTNGDKLVIEFGEQYAPYSHFNASWQNCTWSNVNFNPPN